MFIQVVLHPRDLIPLPLNINMCLFGFGGQGRSRTKGACLSAVLSMELILVWRLVKVEVTCEFKPEKPI